MSDSDSSPKENILRIMDDFLSHLNRTKKLFMILIFASFVIAPLSLIFAVFVLTPQFVMQAGQPYDVMVSFSGIPAQVEPFDIIHANQSNTIGNFTVFNAPISASQFNQGNLVMIQNPEMAQMVNQTTWIVDNSTISLQYVPADNLAVEPFFVASPAPRFMYVGNDTHFGRQTDVTTLVSVIVIVSAILAVAWLVIGVKEFRFFSKWNQRYSNYKKRQDELDKDLQE